MQSDNLRRRAAQPVPRYTSYPTAAQFTDAVGPEAYAAALAALPAGAPVSVYAHIPFCDSLCWFCGCHTKITARYQPVADYLDVLCREIDLVAEITGDGHPAMHVHWGGGSPDILSPEDIRRLAATIFARFPLRRGAEFAVEIDPRALTPERVAAFAAVGVNRASIGVQDLSSDVQAAINRIQTFEQTAAAIAQLETAGITAVNVDLIYGLPHQTADSVAWTADAVAGLNPRRIAVFGYAHVPWMKKHMQRIDTAALPDSDARWDQAQAIADVLQAHGYVPIGLDHYARPDDPMVRAMQAGRLHRNFQGYTVDSGEYLLGFGASAIGSLPGLHVQNAVPLHAYAEAIAKGELATARGVRLAQEDVLRGRIIERLMCDLEVDVEAVAASCGTAAGRVVDAWPRLAALAQDGLLAIEGAKVRVPPENRALLRLAAAAFDPHAAALAEGQQRHAKAV